MHRPHHAFTLLEVMLALALAVLLIGGSLGLFSMVFTEDRLSAVRFKQETELQTAQIIIRRAMQTLVAGAPEEPDANPQAKPDDLQAPRIDDPSTPEDESLLTDEEKEQIGVEEAGDNGDATIRGTTPETEDDESEAVNPLLALLSMQPDSEEDFFELFTEEAEGGEVPRLQMVLSTSPVPKSMIPPEEENIEAQLIEKMRPWIRGAFELTSLHDGWALQWLPIDPPGEPFVLARGLASCSWRVLPRRNKDDERSGEWHDIWQAYLTEDFPIAVELSMRTTKGISVNWVFETVVKGP